MYIIFLKPPNFSKTLVGMQTGNKRNRKTSGKKTGMGDGGSDIV